MVFISALLVTLVLLTNSLKNKICECPGGVVSAPALKSINDALYENQLEIDSISVDTSADVPKSIRELQQRYRK